MALVNTAPRAIHHLNCGTMCPRGARLIAGEGGLFASARLVCHCLLIEGAEGLVLVDTGFGLDDTRNPRQLGLPFTTVVRPRADAAETAISQIRELGFEPGDVRHIVTTHLDLDHAGGLPDFPDAEVHLLGTELDAAMHPGWRERSRYIAAHWAHGPRWSQHDAGGDEWFGFDSVRILPGSDAEILLIFAPGPRSLSRGRGAGARALPAGLRAFRPHNLKEGTREHARPPPAGAPPRPGGQIEGPRARTPKPLPGFRGAAPGWR